VKNTCEFIKNDNILENKKLLLKDIQCFFAIELPWEEIWGRRFKNLANRKSKQLQWKVIHRIIYTEERLQR
jgi:2-hydroxychromene-2-carboxylate isomerase